MIERRLQNKEFFNWLSPEKRAEMLKEVKEERQRLFMPIQLDEPSGFREDVTDNSPMVNRMPSPSSEFPSLQAQRLAKILWRQRSESGNLRMTSNPETTRQVMVPGKSMLLRELPPIPEHTLSKIKPLQVKESTYLPMVTSQTRPEEIGPRQTYSPDETSKWSRPQSSINQALQESESHYMPMIRHASLVSPIRTPQIDYPGSPLYNLELSHQESEYIELPLTQPPLQPLTVTKNIQTTIDSPIKPYTNESHLRLVSNTARKNQTYPQPIEYTTLPESVQRLTIPVATLTESNRTLYSERITADLSGEKEHKVLPPRQELSKLQPTVTMRNRSTEIQKSKRIKHLRRRAAYWTETSKMPKQSIKIPPILLQMKSLDETKNIKPSRQSEETSTIRRRKVISENIPLKEAVVSEYSLSKSSKVPVQPELLLKREQKSAESQSGEPIRAARPHPIYIENTSPAQIEYLNNLPFFQQFIIQTPKESIRSLFISGIKTPNITIPGSSENISGSTKAENIYTVREPVTSYPEPLSPAESTSKTRSIYAAKKTTRSLTTIPFIQEELEPMIDPQDKSESKLSLKGESSLSPSRIEVKSGRGQNITQ